MRVVVGIVTVEGRAGGRRDGVDGFVDDPRSFRRSRMRSFEGTSILERSR